MRGPINDEMKLAAVHALADLCEAGCSRLCAQSLLASSSSNSGPEYIIPKPFDSRVLIWESQAVAKAAVETGVAGKPIADWGKYADQLMGRLGHSQEVMRKIVQKAKRAPKRIVFLEGKDPKIPSFPARSSLDERIAYPILLGCRSVIERRIGELHLDLGEATIVDPAEFPRMDEYILEFFKLRSPKGDHRTRGQAVTFAEHQLLRSHDGPYGRCRRAGRCGVNRHYPDTIRPALQTLPPRPADFRPGRALHDGPAERQWSSLQIRRVNIEPTAEQLAEIAISSADAVRHLNIEPKVAMLSFSNFGSTPSPAYGKGCKGHRHRKENNAPISKSTGK